MSLGTSQFSEHVLAAPKEFLESWKTAPEIAKLNLNTLNKPENMGKIGNFWAFLPLRLKFDKNPQLPLKNQAPALDRIDNRNGSMTDQ